MVEVTIEISDELAARLEPLRDRLPQLLDRVLDTVSSRDFIGDRLFDPVCNYETSPVYNEVLDFLMSRPTHREIAEFKVSLQALDRLETLLEKNRQGTLSSVETAELDLYEQLDGMIMSLKAKAYGTID